MEIQRTERLGPVGREQSLLDAFIAKVRSGIRASSELTGKTIDSKVIKYGEQRGELYFKTPDRLDNSDFETIVSREAKTINSENGFSVDKVVSYDNSKGDNRSLESTTYVMVHIT